MRSRRSFESDSSSMTFCSTTLRNFTDDSLGVLFRPQQAAQNHAPASLRLQMREYRKVHILKQRGGNQGIDVDLPPAEDVPQQPQLWELPAWNNDVTQQGAASA